MRRDLLVLLPFLGAVVVFAGVALWRPASPSVPEVALDVGAGPGAGDRVRLGDLVGEVVLLDFWASWCRPCYRGVPVLNDLADVPGLRIYGVNVEALAPEALREAHGTLGARFPTLDDRDGALQAAFGVQNLPTMVALDRTGAVAFVEVGVPDPESLRRRLVELGVSPRL
ncbi:MAG: TlpA disulfide reductase family protein [Myxococcota bacterium]